MQRQFSLSVFVFIDSLVVSASQDAGGYATSRQNNLELHLGCDTCWLSCSTLVCLWCWRTGRRSVGVRSRDYQIFSDGSFTTFSYLWCFAARASRARALLKRKSLKSGFGFLNWNLPWGRISRRWNPFFRFCVRFRISQSNATIYSGLESRDVIWKRSVG